MRTPTHITEDEEMVLLNDNILVRRDNSHKQSKGGILLPDSAQRAPNDMGVVMAIGPGEYDEKLNQRKEMGCKVGDEIIFSPHVPKTNLKYNGEDCFIIAARHIFAIVETVEVEEPIETDKQTVPA